MEKIKVKFNVDEVYALSYDNKEYEKFIQGIIDACSCYHDKLIFDFPVMPQIGMRVDIMDFARSRVGDLKISPEQKKCLIDEDFDSVFPIIDEIWVQVDHIEIYLRQNEEDK